MTRNNEFTTGLFNATADVLDTVLNSQMSWKNVCQGHFGMLLYKFTGFHGRDMAANFSFATANKETVTPPTMTSHSL